MITPAQTVGPYFAIGLPWPDGPGRRARRRRRDRRAACSTASGEPVPDALIETWQADPSGSYEAEGFRGFGRCPTDAGGRWEIRTVKPGAVGDQAPHIAVAVFARGLLNRVVTRIYFPEDAAAHAGDPVLARARRARAGDAGRGRRGRRIPVRHAPPGSR